MLPYLENSTYLLDVFLLLCENDSFCIINYMSFSIHIKKNYRDRRLFTVPHPKNN